MKIGFFLPNATFDLPGTPEVGGIESFTFTVGEAMQKLGHEVILFGGQPKAGRSHRTTSLQLELNPYWETRSIPDIGTRFQRLVQRLHFGWSCGAAWQKQKCDVVILAKPFDWPVAWYWKRTMPKLRVIMGFHGTDFFAGDRLFFGAVDASFAVSRAVSDLAFKRVKRRPVLIPNPVDMELFSPGDQLGAAGIGTFHIVASGRLVGWKGFHKLLEAVSTLRQMGKLNGLGELRVSIAGSGPEEESLKKLCTTLGLVDVVTFRGRLSHPDLIELLRSGDLYIAPSVGLEAFSIAALEAACVGLPLILSDQVGLADFLDKIEFTAYPPQNTEVLANTLLQAWKASAKNLPEDELVRRKAQHANLFQRFSAENIARQILSLFKH